MADPPAACPTTAELRGAKCVPCEGGVPKLSREQAEARIGVVEGWTLSEDADGIEKRYDTGDFVTALAFVNRVGLLAEADGHHPDLHLTGYRHLRIVLNTHAIGGLSDNDFILAAKIDALGDPKAAKKRDDQQEGGAA